jgi:hypothetical protein
MKRVYTVPTGPTGEPVELWADSHDDAVRLWARLEAGPASRGEPFGVGNLRLVLDAFADLAAPYVDVPPQESVDDGEVSA